MIQHTKPTARHWSFKEDFQYHLLLIVFYDYLGCKKRSQKIFKEISKFIITKNGSQCRSHHQKKVENFKNETDLLYMFYKENYQDRMLGEDHMKSQMIHFFKVKEKQGFNLEEIEKLKKKFFQNLINLKFEEAHQFQFLTRSKKKMENGKKNQDRLSKKCVDSDEIFDQDDQELNLRDDDAILKMNELTKKLRGFDPQQSNLKLNEVRNSQLIEHQIEQHSSFAKTSPQSADHFPYEVMEDYFVEDDEMNFYGREEIRLNLTGIKLPYNQWNQRSP